MPLLRANENISKTNICGSQKAHREMSVEISPAVPSDLGIYRAANLLIKQPH